MMSLSRRQFMKQAGVLASAAALPSWLAESLHAQAAQPLIRHNISSSSPEAVAAVRMYTAAVAEMKKRKPHQPTSWQFQANIHSWPGQYGATAADPQQEFHTVFASDSTNEPLARRVWGTCTHDDPTVAFLPWHRLYLFFFERIMRAAAGEAASSRLGLPYWDWTKDRTLPLPFRAEVNGDQKNNPLYWDIRRQSVTRLSNPVSLPNGTASAGLISTLLDRDVFARKLDPTAAVDFNAALEGGPHGDVHVFVGVSPRGMGFFEEAGRDPCFWTHHCNIDRLWSHWRQRSGHTEPVDAQVPLNVPNNQRKRWSEIQHSFIDENGKEVVLTTSQVLAAAQILDRGYEYDDLPAPIAIASNAPPPAPTAAAAPLPPAAKPATPPVRTLASAGAIEVSGGPAAVTLQFPTAAAAPVPGGAPATAISERILVLKDIAASARGDGLYGVYVNLPPTALPSPDSPYFVGTINTFTAAAAGQSMSVPAGSARDQSGAQHAHTAVEQRLPLTEALSRQQWKEGDPIRITVAPVALDNTLAAPAPAASAAAAPPPGPALRIGGVDILGY
jgi:tyrosinase